MNHAEQNENLLYLAIESTVFQQYYNLINFISDAKKTDCDVGVRSTIKKEERRIISGNCSTKGSVINNKGKDLLKVSQTYTSFNNVGIGRFIPPMDMKVSIETNMLKIFMEQGKYVKLSEYALGVVSALSETLYTPEGKQKFERIDAKDSVAKALKPLSVRDSSVIEKKILGATKMMFVEPGIVMAFNAIDKPKRVSL
ncbi:MAG: hypothetical protein LBI79_02585 [Nitrososphaerota archaeon]|jgi:hypothetical protein|nr:hypothetical protein [Nitrososphaerota archaeon]